MGTDRFCRMYTARKSKTVEIVDIYNNINN